MVEKGACQCSRQRGMTSWPLWGKVLRPTTGIGVSFQPLDKAQLLSSSRVALGQHQSRTVVQRTDTCCSLCLSSSGHRLCQACMWSDVPAHPASCPFPFMLLSPNKCLASLFPFSVCLPENPIFKRDTNSWYYSWGAVGRWTFPWPYTGFRDLPIYKLH